MENFFRVRYAAQATVVVAILYSISHRTPQQFIDEALPLGIFFTVLAYLLILTKWPLLGPPKSWPRFLVAFFIIWPIAIAVVTVFYWAMWIALKDGYLWIEQLRPPRAFFTFLVGSAVVLIGGLLFLFRLHVRFHFGLSEAVLGLLIAIHNIPAEADPALWSTDIFLAMMTASVFLIVRGLDNMHQGKKSDAMLRELCEYPVVRPYFVEAQNDIKRWCGRE